MQYNLYFDFAAVFAFAAMIVSVIVKKTIYTSSGRFFLVLLVSCFFSCIFDIMSVSTNLGHMTMYVSSVLYIFFRALTALTVCFYLIVLTNNIHKLKKYPILGFIIFIPFIVILGLLSTNQITNWIFVISDEGYNRGNLLGSAILYSSLFIYMLIGFIVVIKYRRFFSKEKLSAILSIFFIGIIAGLIQILIPNLLLELFCSAISSFFIILLVERPEEVYDPEIGLKKYSAFIMDANKAVETKKPIAIVFIKIMNESQISTQTSYSEQISIRKTIGKIIKNTSNDFSLIGEYYWLGLGRFVAVIWDHNMDNAESFANTLRRRLNVPIRCSYGLVDIYSNLALAYAPEDVRSFEMLDAFMDSFYHIPSILNKVFDLKNVSSEREFEIKMNMETIIKNAFLNDRFEVHFQPIYSVKDKKFTAAEALLRLNDKTYGYIEPSLFLPEAERNGSIHKLGDFVLDYVCKFIGSKEFKDTKLDYIEVNLSVTQCTHEDLPIRVKDFIKKYNVEPSHLNINVIESNDSYSQKLMESNIKTLKEFGVAFSLDDYGSGYTNINNVTSLPVDCIKLDKSLINNNDNPELQAILENTIKMIRDMKRKIVVEGVETEEKLATFESYLCDYIQGYYFSKPLPMEEFVEFINNKKK